MKGAREIIEYLAYGIFCFGSAGDDTVYILVYSVGQQHMWLYEVNLQTNAVKITKLSGTISAYAETVFEKGHFYIKANKELFIIEAATGKYIRAITGWTFLTLCLQTGKSRCKHKPEGL